MFELKNGVLAVNKKRRITKRQEATLKRLSGIRRSEYLSSILGFTRKHVDVSRLKSTGFDELREKDENHVLDLYRNSRRLYASHSPLNVDLGDWVGVEIECFLPGEEGRIECDSCCGRGVHDIIDDDGNETGETYDCDDCGGTGYVDGDDMVSAFKDRLRQLNTTRVTVKGDGSLNSSDGVGIEVTVLYNAKRGHDPLKRVLDVLNEFSAYVNDTCGLHVHLDMRHVARDFSGNQLNREVTKIGERIGACLPVLKHLVPESRRSNTYCKLDVAKVTGGDRYYAVNCTAFEKFKTIEVRLHSGTCDFKKISNWIELIRLISRTSALDGRFSNNDDIVTFQDLIDVTGMPDRLVEYLEKRIKKFSPDFLNQFPAYSEGA